MWLEESEAAVQWEARSVRSGVWAEESSRVGDDSGGDLKDFGSVCYQRPMGALSRYTFLSDLF